MKPTIIYQNDGVKPDQQQNGGSTLLKVFENGSDVRLVVVGFHYGKDVPISDETIKATDWAAMRPVIEANGARRVA